LLVEEVAVERIIQLDLEVVEQEVIENLLALLQVVILDLH
jgi:hypothetical protein